MIPTYDSTHLLYGTHPPLPSLHSAVGVRQNQILSKLSKPFAAQPVSVSNSLPLHAAGTAGTEPNQEARSPCSLGFNDHSSHLYAQLGCGASTCIIVVSAQPVAPSTGIVDATGTPSMKLTWKGQEPEATTPSFLKSSIWT